MRIEKLGIKNITTHTVYTAQNHLIFDGRDFELTEAGFEAINNATDVNDLQINQLSVYPNTAIDFVTISSPLEGNLKLYSITGELVIEQDYEGSTKVSIQGLKQGLYVVRLETDNNIFSKKLLIE